MRKDGDSDPQNEGDNDIHTQNKGVAVGAEKLHDDVNLKPCF